MTRQFLIVVGAALLGMSGLGFIIGLVWLWSSVVHGTPQYVLEARFQTMLYILPALLLGVAFIGACLMINSLAARHESAKRTHDLPMQTRFRA